MLFRCAQQNVQIYEEKEELVNIVKQAAKERLQLEQQLAHSKTREVRVVSLPSASLLWPCSARDSFCCDLFSLTLSLLPFGRGMTYVRYYLVRSFLYAHLLSTG